MKQNYSVEDMQETISILLSYIDELCGPGIHYRGQTPDWYVAAAMISCNIPDTNPPAITYVRELK